VPLCLWGEPELPMRHPFLWSGMVDETANNEIAISQIREQEIRFRTGSIHWTLMRSTRSRDKFLDIIQPCLLRDKDSTVQESGIGQITCNKERLVEIPQCWLQAHINSDIRVFDLLYIHLQPTALRNADRTFGDAAFRPAPSSMWESNHRGGLFWDPE
jgi:hypothetical protein